MEFKSQICTDINQSRKLLELGLKKETADMGLVYMTHNLGGKEIEPVYLGESIGLWEGCDERQTVLFSRRKQIPAWSLHRLIEMYTERYLACSVNLKIFTYEWLINEIEIHIKEGDFNKDYLEEKK